MTWTQAFKIAVSTTVLIFSISLTVIMTIRLIQFLWHITEPPKKKK